MLAVTTPVSFKLFYLLVRYVLIRYVKYFKYVINLM